MRKNLWVYDLFRVDFVRGALTGDPKRERVRGRSGRAAGGAFKDAVGEEGRGPAPGTASILILGHNGDGPGPAGARPLDLDRETADREAVGPADG